MEWGRLFANLPDDPRVQKVEASDGAGWLITESMCYLTRAESGGFIPDTQIPRFGGTRLKQKVAALVREGIYRRVVDGYMFDPDLWNEGRNLSDSAEKKKEADRERQARKRAADKAKAAKAAREFAEASRDLSRDSHVTDHANGHAIDRGDSRYVEERREDNPPLPPPVTDPWASSAATPEGEGDQDQHPTPAELDAFIAEIQAQRQAWGSKSIRQALTNPDVAERPWPVVMAAMRIVADDRQTNGPGRLGCAGDWWGKAEASVGPSVQPWPPHCGDPSCHPVRRWRNADSDHPAKCPVCHPSNVQQALAS